MGISPVFNARQVSSRSLDKLFRVYLVGDTLYFIRIGGAGGVFEGLTHHLGLLGFLFGPAIARRAEKKERERVGTIDRTDPGRLLAAHGDNFRLGAADVREATVDPPWLLATHGPHVGRFQLVLGDGTRTNFQFERTADMLVGLDVLSGLLGARLRINVRWNELARRFERGESAAWRVEES